jgi:hypothetical protein
MIAGSPTTTCATRDSRATSRFPRNGHALVARPRTLVHGRGRGAWHFVERRLKGCPGRDALTPQRRDGAAFRAAAQGVVKVAIANSNNRWRQKPVSPAGSLSTSVPIPKCRHRTSRSPPETESKRPLSRGRDASDFGRGAGAAKLAISLGRRNHALQSPARSGIRLRCRLRWPQDEGVADEPNRFAQPVGTLPLQAHARECVSRRL